MLITLVSFIVLLLILIFVHEFGHFSAAKLLGVRVERFSLGFPPKIFSKKFGDTEYQIAWLPLGGYVKLFGEEPGEEIPQEERKYSFSHKPAWVKIIVVAAGPAFNIVFAVVAMWLMSWVIGMQHQAPVIGPLAPDSPAALSGLRMDDVVTAVDGRSILYFDELREAEESSAGKAMELSIRRGGGTFNVVVSPVQREGRTILGDSVTGWSMFLTPRTLPVVGQVLEGKPAALAGLEPGDLILAVNGQPTPDWQDVVKAIQGSQEARSVEDPSEPGILKIDFLRGGESLSREVTPVMEPSQDLEGRTLYTRIVGLTPHMDLLVEPVGPFRALGMGLTDTWNTIDMTVGTLVRLFQNKISAKVMGGPILIAEIAGRKARDGLAEFIYLMAFISINLAILNILPLPVLDGGQLVIFVIEGIRRRTLSLRFREITQWIGVTALAALMILVFYNDISRLVTRFSSPPTVHTEKTE